MYNNDNTKWFSQTLLTYKDRTYGTDGYLRLSISTNTEDYKFFNPPVINISISNNYQKTYNINIQHAKDLVKTFKVVMSQSNGNNSEIQRKYQRKTLIYFKFFVETSNNTPVVLIEIRDNETDFTRVIVPLKSIFETFASCIRYYTENYFNICIQLLGQSINSENTQIIQQLPSLIKGISSQIVSQNTFPDSPAPEIDKQDVAKTEANINDLDNFLGADMENIDVPEIESQKEAPITEIASVFVEKVLENNLYNLESIMINHTMNPNPFVAIAKYFKEKVEYDIKGENFTMLPSINDDDLKSISYMSKLYFSIAHQNYLNNGMSLPDSTPIFKYNPSDYQDENIEIAYDLFLFGLYVRCLRRKLEGKTSDIIQSKSLFYIQIRCFTDPFVFSFINKVDTNKLQSIISNRYKYYDNKGIFSKYKQLLIDMNCPEIKEDDIMASVQEAVDKAIGKIPNIDKLHDISVESNGLRLPSKNPFSLEQIINEIIPLEVAEKIGKDITSKNVLEEIKSKYTISDEILNFFSKSGKKVKVTQTTKTPKTNNLIRLVKHFSDEIPEQYKESFMKYLKELTNKKFNFETTSFPIDEFGDNIVKALYVWDPEIKGYKDLFLKVEEELMEKDLILAKFKNGEDSEDSDWGSALNNI